MKAEEATPERDNERERVARKVVAWIGQTRTDLEETKAIRRYLVGRASRFPRDDARGQ